MRCGSTGSPTPGSRRPRRAATPVVAPCRSGGERSDRPAGPRSRSSRARWLPPPDRTPSPSQGADPPRLHRSPPRARPYGRWHRGRAEDSGRRGRCCRSTGESVGPSVDAGQAYGQNRAHGDARAPLVLAFGPMPGARARLARSHLTCRRREPGAHPVVRLLTWRCDAVELQIRPDRSIRCARVGVAPRAGLGGAAGRRLDAGRPVPGDRR